MGGHRWRGFLGALAACYFSGLAPVFAHPHVWVTARATLLFDKEGRVAGIRHDWTFDDMYSAFATEGLAEKGKPPTRAQMEKLAQTNVDSLNEFDYFTFAKQAGHKLEFGAPIDFYLDADDKLLVTLHFTLPLKQPVAARQPFSFQVYDPTYFVSFSFEKKDPIALNGAPAGCSSSLVEPPPLLAAESKKLADAASENFSPGVELSMRVSPRVVLACP